MVAVSEGLILIGVFGLVWVFDFLFGSEFIVSGCFRVFNWIVSCGFGFYWCVAFFDDFVVFRVTLLMVIFLGFVVECLVVFCVVVLLFGLVALFDCCI